MFEQKLKRVLVPVEGVPSDEDSVRLACTQAKRDKSDIVLLYVIEVKRNLPIDAEIGEEQGKGERVLDELEHFAHQQGIRVQTDLVQAREAGPAIVGAAIERGTDLVIMGVPYREKFGNFNVESRAIHVLENAPCRVCLVRQPLKSAVER